MIGDTQPGTGSFEPSDIRLALSAARLESAVPGAALDLGAKFLSGVVR
jgi:hypothetical protein